MRKKRSSERPFIKNYATNHRCTIQEWVEIISVVSRLYNSEKKNLKNSYVNPCSSKNQSEIQINLLSSLKYGFYK